LTQLRDASFAQGFATAEGPPGYFGPGPERFRAGERALTILATPLNCIVLKALARRPMRLADLRRAAGLPAQTTLRGHLANLGEFGAVRKQPTDRTPYAVETSLTPMGRELLELMTELERWLGRAPDGPVSLESGAGKGIVKALIDGWGSTILRELAVESMSLTELDRAIPDLSYPALERRLSSMRMAGLVEARESTGAGTPYAVTDWARRGVAALAAAGRCEQAHLQDGAAPITQADIEAAFLLVTPLVELPVTANGTCQLEVEADQTEMRRQAGISVTIERGRVVACDSRLGPAPADFAVGTMSGWFGAIQDGTASLLRFGGSRRVAEAMVLGLHAALVIQ
jgi:DNA-binding HxlR family transcriptional regulator